MFSRIVSRQFVERQADARQSRRVGHDDDLLFVAAAGVDLRDARCGAEQRADDVFLNLLERHAAARSGVARLVRRVGRELDGVVEDLAQSRADGRKPGLQAGRQFLRRARSRSLTSCRVR